MKEFFEYITSSILALIIFVLLILGFSYVGWLSYDYFAPKYRATENKVFKESEQYNDGMVRDLENLQMEYMNADKDHQQALRAIILHRFSVYPEDKMPANLRNFYNQLRSGK
jgi:hypothetical protein